MEYSHALRLVFSIELLNLMIWMAGGRGISEHLKQKSLRQSRMGSLKQEILTKLGVSALPFMPQLNSTVAEKRAMVKLYKDSLATNKDITHSLQSEGHTFARKLYSFTDSGHFHVPREGQTAVREGHAAVREGQAAVRLFFPVLIAHPDDHLRETSVQSAFLKIYISKFHPGPQPNSRIVLKAYQLLEDHRNTDASPPKRKLLDSMFVHVDHTGWVKFDVKEAVHDWHNDPATNHGIEVAAEDWKVSEVITIITSKSSDSDHLPTVNIYTKEQSILGRSKREADFKKPFNCMKGDEEWRCCRYPLWVSFREIGWDWVIAPDGFQAYYCDGSCPYKFRAAHRFSSVQSILHMLNPSSAPAPSCTPTQLSPLSLLHITDTGQMTVTQFGDMVVGNCGCA